MVGVIVSRQPVNHNVGQRDNITPPSTGRHQHRSTSSADNIYRHLPVLHHRHLRLYYYIRYQHLPVRHLRHSSLWIIGVNTIKITHSDLRLLTWITYLHHLGLRRIILVRGRLTIITLYATV